MFAWMLMSVAMAGNPFRVEIQPLKMTMTEPNMVDVFFVVPAGYHLYQDMMKVEVATVKGLTLGNPQFPAGKLIPDPANPENWREVFDETVKVEVPIIADTEGVFTPEFTLTYQGCKDTLCYMPKSDVIQSVVIVQPLVKNAQ